MVCKFTPRSRKKLCCFLLTILMLASASCAKQSAEQTVSAKNIFNEKTVSVSLPVRNVESATLKAYGFSRFSSDCSLSEILENLSGSEDYEVTPYENALLLQCKGEDSTDFYCIAPYGSGYVFTGMLTTVIYDLDPEHRLFKKILFPVHLTADPSFCRTVLDAPHTAYLDREYLTYGREEDFLQFFLDCGWYDVQYEPGCITVTDWADDAPCDAEAVVHKYHPHEALLPFCIRMEQREDGLYFSFVNVPQ